MAEEVFKRDIADQTVLELWARAGGRCEFNGCNKLLYKSPLTQEPVNISQKAHIYSFSANGPRGRGPYKNTSNKINSTENLMLMCHECHKLIDDDHDGSQYSAPLLRSWKIEHEKRILIATEINPTKKSHVVTFSSPIGQFIPKWDNNDSFCAMFPHRYPAQEFPIDISIKTNEEEFSSDSYRMHIQHLEKEFNRKIKERIEDGSINHISLFALAPQPLLILLGKLIGNIIPVDVYQRHRIPEQSWMWPENEVTSIKFNIIRPSEIKRNKIVLLFALSADIKESEISTALQSENYDLWKITIEEPSVHFMQSREALSDFYKLVGGLYDELKNIYGSESEIHLFPAMPNSCAIMAGRALMPKTNMPVLIYDKVALENEKKFVFFTNLQ